MIFLQQKVWGSLFAFSLFLLSVTTAQDVNVTTNAAAPERQGKSK
jgi:hypothetical protein